MTATAELLERAQRIRVFTPAMMTREFWDKGPPRTQYDDGFRSGNDGREDLTLAKQPSAWLAGYVAGLSSRLTLESPPFTAAAGKTANGLAGLALDAIRAPDPPSVQVDVEWLDPDSHPISSDLWVAYYGEDGMSQIGLSPAVRSSLGFPTYVRIGFLDRTTLVLEGYPNPVEHAYSLPKSAVNAARSKSCSFGVAALRGRGVARGRYYGTYGGKTRVLVDLEHFDPIPRRTVSPGGTTERGR